MELTRYNIEMDENKDNTATQDIIGLSDMNFHHNKMKQNKINDNCKFKLDQ